MSSIDERVVQMRFDNAEFKRAALETRKSLDDINKSVDAAGKTTGLMNLSSGMMHVSASASRMAIVTTTAMATVVSRVTSGVLNMSKNVFTSMTSTIFQAGKARAIALEQAKFQFRGLGLNVNKTMASALEAVKGTAFGLQDAATMAAQFGGSGMKAGKQMTAALRGISGMAAQTGRSYSEIGQVMTGIAGVGKVTTQDLMQFGVRGLNVAAAMGKQMKKSELEIRGMVSKGQISFKQFAAMMDKAFGKNATKSNQTYTGSLANMKAALSRIGADIKAPQLNAFKKIFNTLTPAIDATHEALMPVLKSLAHIEMKGANKLVAFIKSLDPTKIVNPVVQGIKNIIAPFVAIFKAVGDAWHQVFPPSGAGSAETVYKVANGFETLTKPLAWLATQIPKITPILASFFKIFKMGAIDVKGVAQYIGELASAFVNMFSIKAPASGGVTSFFQNMLKGIGNLFRIGIDAAKAFFDGLLAGFQSGSFDGLANVIGTGLMAGIFILIRKIMKNGIKQTFDLTGGLADSIKGTFGALTDTLTTMQQQLKTKTLMNIAAAVALLSASILALSFIDGKKLAKSLAAISVGMAELLIGMSVLNKIGGLTAFVRIPIIAAGMVLLAAAILILTSAIAIMSLLSWNQIGKGLIGVGGALFLIAAGMKAMPLTLPITAAGLVLFSTALVGITTAIGLMSLLSWGQIGKGLATLAGSLILIAAGMKAMPSTLPLTAAGLLLVGIALNGIGTAVKIMGSMSWKEIGRGLATLGGSMAILAGGLNLMSGTVFGSAAMLIAATAIGVLVPSLILMSKLSWKEIGRGLAALAGGLIILAGALAVIGASGILGAAALMIVAPAILVLATALTVLGKLSWEELGKSLVGLAAGLTIIGVAGALITPVIPSLLGLGAALLLLGAGLALAGAGILAFGTGLSLVVGLGAVAISYLTGYITGFIKLLPGLGKGLADFLVSWVKGLVKQAPILVDAFITVISSLLDSADKLLPKLAVTFDHVLDTVLKVIRKSTPKIVSAGMDVLIAFLNGVASRIGEVTNAGTNLIIKFIQGVSAGQARIVRAAAQAIIDFVNALAKTIREMSPQLGDAMGNLGVAMVEGLIAGIGSMAKRAFDAIGNLSSGLVNKAKSMLKVFSPSRVFRDIGKFLVKGLTNGITGNAAFAIKAVASMVGGQIAVANEYVSKFIQKLDQQSIAARSKAMGLASAAQRASKAADKTKTKTDDKAADKLASRAVKADKVATKAEAKAEAAKNKQDRQEQFRDSSTLEKAQMRSEDAQNQLDAAKRAESRANKNLVEARALDKQAKAKGVTEKQRKAFEKQADTLRAQAKVDAKSANAQLANAKKSAADALAYQKKAGDEAAAAFQAAYLSDAKAAADAATFDKLTDAEKAVERRKQADALQKKADADLAKAKKLAYTDLAAANDLASQAIDEASQARQYLDDAMQFAQSAQSATPTAPNATAVLNLQPVDAAAMAMAQFNDLYLASSAAASADRTVQFTQYNTSPESLSPTEIYRNTNNLLTYAVDRLDDVA